MCGISGIVTLHSLSSADHVRRMVDVLSHRGPDGSDVWSSSNCCLGHCRLSIIDVAGGKQPMSNEDRTVWITYNGEIYNHRSIRHDLEQLGHRYRTNCDTETIVHAYEQWGADCLNRFQGMFSFAVWDTKNNSLFVARDRMGIKPFYFASTPDGTLVFASEIKAILTSSIVPTGLNAERLPEHLTFGYISGSDTLFSGIQELPPGHCGRWENGEMQVRRYWDAEPTDQLELPQEEIVGKFRDLFDALS